MKKAFYAIVAFNFIIYSCRAQELQLNKWDFGVQIGTVAGKMLWADKIESSNTFFIQYPKTDFRLSYSFGCTTKYNFNSKFYLPFNLDYINRKFAIGTGGAVLVRNENGQYAVVRADYIDYSLNQISIAGGLGYKFIKSLALEVQPYYQISLSNQQFKIKEFTEWANSEDFKQTYDFGLSGSIRFDLHKIYAKVGYQYGIRNITEYTAYDASGATIGKFPIRNTMVSLYFGYYL